MQQGSRFILSTREWVRVPPFLACEMRPFDERLANFRAHGAGFIDPGWGYGPQGDGPGRPLTLEVEPYEDDIIIQRGEAIAKIRFEWVAGQPDNHYDAGKPSYGGQQTAKLANQFY
jgi:dCTP deaminase